MNHPLHHLALGAHDVGAIAAFYRQAFGLAELTRHFDDQGQLRSIWLDLGGTILMVEGTTLSAPPVDTIGVGPFLLAFAISVEDRDAMEERLAHLGSPIEERTDYTSYARDPEGNRIAISHYPTPPRETLIDAD